MTSNMCVELICSVIKSGYILKATLGYVLWLGFLQENDFPQTPTTAMLFQSFQHLVKSYLNSVSTKVCSAFLHFAFITF